MAFSRRDLFPLTGVAAASFVSIGDASAASIDRHGALNLSVRKLGPVWEVCVPMEYRGWRPGVPIAVEWVPLSLFLSDLETEIEAKNG